MHTRWLFGALGLGILASGCYAPERARKGGSASEAREDSGDVFMTMATSGRRRDIDGGYVGERSGSLVVAGIAAPELTANRFGGFLRPKARAGYGGDSPADDLLPEPPDNTEDYEDYGVRTFVDTRRDRLSTFSVDVDTASYTIARRKLREGVLPPPASVRVEEFVNFFDPRYPSPAEGAFTVLSEASASPFRAGKTILRVGLQGRRVGAAQRKPANLVFLVDVSGSMRSSDKLDLVKQSLAILVNNLTANDYVSICTYAGNVAVVLPPTPAHRKPQILSALRRLTSGGATGMASGIDLAYQMAALQASPGRTTRVIVCSDGDANVGPQTHQGILRLIARHRDKGIYLGTVGFGMGNYKDTLLEQLANKGDGIYAYVDDLGEAERLFSEELVGTLEVIARDVKLQVAFYPKRVRRYRLLGYENRAIRDREFRDDAIDAGEVGAGHSVTAIYELDLVPGSEGALGEVRVRHKHPDQPRGARDVATELVFSLTAHVQRAFGDASNSFRFTVCVAEFAEILRKSPHTNTRLEELLVWTRSAVAGRYDHREQELVGLIRRAATIASLQGL